MVGQPGFPLDWGSANPAFRIEAYKRAPLLPRRRRRRQSAELQRRGGEEAVTYFLLLWRNVQRTASRER